MDAQRYRISHLSDDRPKKGAFVFSNDNDDIVMGFITEVTDEYSEVCLFEHTDVSEVTNLVEVIDKTVTKFQVNKLLQETLADAPEMKTQWIKLIREAHDVNTA